MGNDNKIWTFVEDKLKCQVPAYIKNVLEVCGYTNGMTIATIEDDDIQYFEAEVKNGNVMKHFGSERDVLEGSQKTVENFEFVRGHVKFLMKIRDLVKSHMDINGPDSFTVEANTSNNTVKAPKEMGDEEKLHFPQKRKNSSKDSAVKSKIIIISPETITEEDHNKHRKVIFTNCIRSLDSHTPKLFKEGKERITIDIVKTEVISQFKTKSDSSSEVETVFKLVGEVRCPYCPTKKFNVFHVPSKKNVFIWKITNFDRHLKHIHKSNIANNNIGTVKDETIEKMQEGVQCENSGIVAKCNENSLIPSGPMKIESPNVHCPFKSKLVCNNIGTVKDETIEKMQEGVQCENSEIVAKYNENSIIPSGPMKIESPDVHCAFKSKLVCYSDSEGSDDEVSDRYGMPKDVPDVNDDIAAIKSINVLDEDVKNEIANIPIFRNGYSSTDRNENCRQTIVTRNTCGFDSVFSIYTCLYFDYARFRETFTDQSKFAMLVKAYYSTFSSNTIFESSQLSKLYTDRNIILKEIFTNGSLSKSVKKNGESIYIDCHTGIGRLFGQLCMEMCPHIGSAIEIKTCEKCKKKTGKILPFIPIATIGIDLRNLQKSIRLPSKDRLLCTECKGKCIVKINYNNILAVEVEPNIAVKLQKKISIQNLTQTIVVEQDFNLFAVIEFDPLLRHFKSHIKRKNKQWITFDDIQTTQIETKVTVLESEGILPYMLFYIKRDSDGHFLNALVANTCENLVRWNQTRNQGENRSMTWKNQLEKNSRKNWKY